MKCAHCKSNHTTVAEVKNCSAGTHSECRHELPTGQCVCNWDRGIRGKGHMKTPIRAKFDGYCFVGKDIVLDGDKLVTHWSIQGWAHLDCFTERDWIQDDPADWRDQTSDSPGPEYSGTWDRKARLEAAADLLITDAITTERTSTVAMLRQIEQDMGEPIGIDLISETFDYDSWEWVRPNGVGWERAWVRLGLVPDRFRTTEEEEET